MTFDVPSRCTKHFCLHSFEKDCRVNERGFCFDQGELKGLAVRMAALEARHEEMQADLDRETRSITALSLRVSKLRKKLRESISLLKDASNPAQAPDSPTSDDERPLVFKLNANQSTVYETHGGGLYVVAEILPQGREHTSLILHAPHMKRLLKDLASIVLSSPELSYREKNVAETAETLISNIDRGACLDH